jgi:hypothetical protein
MNFLLATLLSLPLAVEPATIYETDGAASVACRVVCVDLPGAYTLDHYQQSYPRYNEFFVQGGVTPNHRYQTRVLYHGEWHRAEVVTGSDVTVPCPVKVVIW